MSAMWEVRVGPLTTAINYRMLNSTELKPAKRDITYHENRWLDLVLSFGARCTDES